ncbi:MAG: hypothetical protein AAFY03_00495 [Pseudomonadota bacterium]
MSHEEYEPSEPIMRLCALKEKDRQAVLMQLSPEERNEIEFALRQLEEAQAAEAERQRQIDRQFLGYSPWLATLIETSEHSSPAGVTEHASRAAWDVHARLVNAKEPTKNPVWWEQLERLSARLGLSWKGGR